MTEEKWDVSLFFPGLLTVAAMLPPEWDKRLVDMNVRKLKDKGLLLADYVFPSAMSSKTVLARCGDCGQT